MIPEAAFEAAARAQGCVWTPVKSKHPRCPECLERARYVLEAVTPILMAKALRDAVEVLGDVDPDDIREWLEERAGAMGGAA